MSILASGVAHLSFTGGGMFLPVRTPYDRQTLIEHVANRVRSKSRVQVLIDRRRWLIDQRANRSGTCATCGHTLDAACFDPARDDRVYCITCVFGEESSSTPNVQPQRRRA